MTFPRYMHALRNLNRLPEVAKCVMRMADWDALLKAYLRLGAAQYPIAFHTRSGLRAQVEDFDEVITAWVVFCRDEYLVPPDAKLIVDCGANYGAFSLMAASAAPFSRIISLEPFPETFEKLRANVEANGLGGRINCRQDAVDRVTGWSWMNASPKIKSHLRHLEDDRNGTDGIRVATVALTELIDQVCFEFGVRSIDLVKLDVEGAEYRILTDAKCCLEKVKALQMEYHGVAPKGILFSAMDEQGFICQSDRVPRRHAPDHGVAHFVRR